jgi:outer membrane protein assembly factor BamB
VDWPQWRGPNRDGSTSVKLPDPWPGELKQLWKVEVGEGHSGPVIVGDKVVAFVRQGEDEVVLCLNAADGKEVWRDAYPAPYEPVGPAKPHGKGPFATPTVADGKVYTFGISGILTCRGLSDGKQVWRKDFAGQFKTTYPEFGAANSPLVENGRCIVGIGGKDDGALAAFNGNTGEVAWKLTGEGPAYASPLAAYLLGERIVLAVTQSRVIGVTPYDGQLLGEQEFKTKYDMSCVTPVVSGDLIVMSGFERGTAAFRVEDAGVPTPVWHNDEVSMHMSSPVVVGGNLYGVSQRKNGRLECLSLADGTTKWTSPDKVGQYASLIAAGDKLLVMKTDGELLVVAADPAAYKELGRNKLTDAPVWAHLALAGDHLYVKDKAHLACFALR